MMSRSLTTVSGLEVGHYTDRSGITGCTVVLCRQGAVAGVDVRGGAPCTRETDLLRSENLVERIHGILLSGGSAFGLAAAGGVMRYLSERGIGLAVGKAVVPIVPSAILFDLGVGSLVHPGEAEGYKACLDASARPVAEGSVGAGTGAVVAKCLGHAAAVKGGLGSAALDLGQGVVVAALVAVNAVGSVVEPDTGEVIAGPRSADGRFLDTVRLLADPSYRSPNGTEAQEAISSTSIGVVATNASLTKAQANKLAQMAHDGLALAIRPCHTMYDGDTMFALATGTARTPADMARLCAVVPWMVSQSVVRAIKKAEGLGGIPSWKELTRHD